MADVKNNVIVTGGSKPAIISFQGLKGDSAEKLIQVSREKQKHPTMAYLKDMAADICQARLGPNFFSVINQCSRRFWEEVQNFNPITSDDVEVRYNSIMEWPQCDDHALLKQETVYCWTFDGYSFKPKAPCIRCLYFYASWRLALSPETIDEKNFALNQIRGDHMKYKDDKDRPCGYCAETVAAAQLFALDHGTMTYLG